MGETDGDRLDVDAYAAVIDERTLIVPTTHVCFRNGHKTDVAALTELAHERGAYSFLDDYQRTGSGPIDVHALGVDFMVTGCLKYLLAAAGVAFLYVRRDLIERFEPTITGWFGRVNPFAFRIDCARLAAGREPIRERHAAGAKRVRGARRAAAARAHRLRRSRAAGRSIWSNAIDRGGSQRLRRADAVRNRSGAVRWSSSRASMRRRSSRGWPSAASSHRAAATACASRFTPTTTKRTSTRFSRALESEAALLERPTAV